MGRFGGHFHIRFARRIRSSFRGRFARRIGLLFVICVLVPISAVGLYSVNEVSSQLRTQSERRLRHASKALGMATFGRLQHLSAELAVQARRVRAGAPLQANLRHFRRVEVVLFPPVDDSDGRWPEWSPSQLEALDRGGAVIGFAALGNDGPAICLARRVDPEGTDGRLVAAEISPEFLWRPMGVSDTVSYWVMDSHRRVLFLSPPPHPPGVEKLALSPTSGVPEAGVTSFHGDSELATCSWNLFLKANFQTPSWSFVACEDRSVVLAPYAGFRQDLTLGLLLVFLLVCLITLTQVRRSLVPLARLWMGTKRIAAGRLDTQVTVRSRDEFSELANSFNEMAERLGRQFRTLRARADIDQAILESFELDGIADSVLTHISQVIPCEASLVLMRDSTDRVRAFACESSTGARMPEAESSVAEFTDVLEDARTLVIRLDDKPSRLWAPLAAKRSGTLFIVPALVDDRVAGAIGVVRNVEDPLSPEDEKDLKQLAAQISVGLSKAHVFQELKELHWGTLTALARTIDAKSPWTSGHSERVTRNALAIARRLGLEDRELENLRRGALLHDIGKIGIPREILDCTRRLTDEEMAIMREHPQLGARILEPIPAFRDALRVVTQHHERFDGEGYPMGLRGNDIQIGARILAVADAFDALIADRPYRRGMSREMALEEIRRCAGTQFDPDVVQAFLQVAGESEHQPSRPAPALTGV